MPLLPDARHRIGDAGAQTMTGGDSAQRSDQALSGVFRQRASACPDGLQVGLALATMWREIDLALSAVIGPAGVIALYRRSLHLAYLKHAWLDVAAQAASGEAFTQSLEQQLAGRSAEQACAAAETMLDEFDKLLASLIGESLSQRLLRTLWSNATTTETPEQKAQR